MWSKMVVLHYLVGCVQSVILPKRDFQHHGIQMKPVNLIAYKTSLVYLWKLQLQWAEIATRHDKAIRNHDEIKLQEFFLHLKITSCM